MHLLNEPLHLIPPEEVKVAEDLIYDRRAEDYDPLQKLMELFEGVSAASARESRAAELAKLPVTYVDLPTGHWPMWSRPEEVANVILETSTS